jgi:hypothetical protein
MEKNIDKIIFKMKNIFNISESDAQVILAGITILGIAIPWFVIGQRIMDDKIEISEEERYQESLAEQFAEDANRDFNKK